MNDLQADLLANLRRYAQGAAGLSPSLHAVIDHGRPYLGIARPKGYRKRSYRKCFYNAGRLALDNRGTYVEGYAATIGPPFGIFIHHAWVTLDSEHAIDVTWDNAAGCGYVGIAFPVESPIRQISTKSEAPAPIRGQSEALFTRRSV